MITITEKEFVKFAAYIEANYGIHLKKEKQSLITGRLQGVLVENGFKSFSEYYDFITSHNGGDAITTFINKITTNHTFFMREAEHFIFLKENVLPVLAAHCRDKDLRIWSAACSSGEEPYTLAMIIDEFFGREKVWWDTKILATDISGKALTIARNGEYANDKVAALPALWRTNYFKKLDRENSIVVEKIKNEVIFRNFNLMEKVFPFKKKFHVIFCRNVMIYFDGPTKEQLVQKFYDMTEYGGYLFIGHSESLNKDTTQYKYVMPAVYRKE